MSTTLRAVFDLVFKNVHFVPVTINIHGRKKRLSASSQNSSSYPKNHFLVNLKSYFSTFKFFPGQEILFLVSTLKVEYFNEKIGSLAGLIKGYSISRKSTDFGHFWLPSSTLKVDFLNVQAKSLKNTQSVPWGKVDRNVLNFELSTILACVAVAVLQVGIFEIRVFS